MKSILIMGNGQSIEPVTKRLHDIKIDTFGMNTAYKYYKKQDWYPTYWACFDRAVTNSHSANLQLFVLESCDRVKRYFSSVQFMDHPQLTVPEMIQPHGAQWDYAYQRKPYHDVGNTGGNCCQQAIDMDYKKLILIGVDCDYKEVVDGAQDQNGKLVMAETPESNPNYGWEDYQEKGDVYNYPRPEIFHRPSWAALARFAKANGIEVVNCSPISTLDMFDKSTLEEEGVY